MERIKGIKNLHPSPPPETILLDDQERLTFIATLIIDYVFQDESNGFDILDELVQYYEWAT